MFISIVDENIYYALKITDIVGMQNVRLFWYLTSHCASVLNQKKTLYHQTQLD
jgi:hypothetical protein